MGTFLPQTFDYKQKALTFAILLLEQEAIGMRKDIHPDYREVVFQDTSSDFKFLTRSTISTDETIEWEDGSTYPLVKVEVTSASHPFYTGKNLFVDTAGRVEKFNRRYKGGKDSRKEAQEARDAEEAKAAE